MSHILTVDETTKTLTWCIGKFIYAQARIARGARVLEVGSGNDPHPASDFVLDKFLDDDSHRPGRAPIQFKREIEVVGNDGRILDHFDAPCMAICGDALALPFADKSFDFIIAKDVLEHVADIEQASGELSRVGKAGFIDVPRMASEWLWPQGAIHQWVFSEEADGLVAHRIAFTSPFGRLLHDALARSEDIQDAWSHSRHYFHLVRIWQGEVKIRMGEPACVIAAHAIKDLTR